MRRVQAIVLGVALATVFVSAADAFPPYGPYGYGPYARPFAYRYGWGPRPYWRRGLSYGTGYGGRGTRTGGPVGGLPNRN